MILRKGDLGDAHSAGIERESLDRYECETCGCHQTAGRRTLFHELSLMVVFVVTRLDFDRQVGVTVRVSTSFEELPSPSASIAVGRLGQATIFPVTINEPKYLGKEEQESHLDGRVTCRI